MGEQFLQQTASSLDTPGRSVAAHAKDINGDPFGNKNSSFQPPRGSPSRQMKALQRSSWAWPRQRAQWSKVTLQWQQDSLENELLQQEGEDSLPP